MPQSEGFYLQTGPRFLFYLAAFLAENFSGTQRKAYKTQSNFTNTSEVVHEPDKIFPYNFLTLWHNSSSSPSPGQDDSVRTQDVHGNVLHLRPANEVTWQAPLYADAFSFIKQSHVLHQTKFFNNVSKDGLQEEGGTPPGWLGPLLTHHHFFEDLFHYFMCTVLVCVCLPNML